MRCDCGHEFDPEIKYRHRLACGDATDAEVIAQVLLAGELVFLTVTSPPYFVGKEYERGLSFEEHLELLRSFADRTIEVTEPGGFLFVNFGEIIPMKIAGPLTGSDRQCVYLISKDYWEIFHEERQCDLYAMRVWYKPFARLQKPFWTYHTSIPHYQEWENLWTWRVPGGDGDDVYDWDASSRAVWDTLEGEQAGLNLRHVAPFPPEIPMRAIKAHSKKGDVVFEPFSGSGTTILACERLGRLCRAIEISPRYLAVSLQRWQDATGVDPVRLNGR